jgi:ribosomal protein S18 acetylase RimI-like enzyme
MPFAIRPARADDVPLISSWTKDTFSWGDYIPDQLPMWLDDPDSLVVVCVFEDDIPVAVSKAQLLTPSEAWLSAARVHPSHRRSGMGSAMNDHAVAWARERGALVARLATEDDNKAARGQVSKSGYRLTGRWVYATAPASRATRAPAERGLRPGAGIDADAAWMFWSASELAQAAHNLISDGWRWRKAGFSALENAVDRHSFYQSPSGWVIATKSDNGLAVTWLATTVAEAPMMLQGMRELAGDSGMGTLEAWLPHTPWIAEALQREGFDSRPVLIYSKTLQT